MRDRRRRSTAKGRSTQSVRQGRAGFRIPWPDQLEQRHLDLIALCTIGFSLYLGFVLYLDWGGGVIGTAAREGLTFALGRLAYAVPFIGALAAAAMIFRAHLPAKRPLRTGGVCIVLGLALALAAQTAGLGSGSARESDFDPTWMSDHGGLIGESLYWVTTTLFSTVGAHIVATILIVAGVLLTTGGTIATFLAATGRAADRARRGAVTARRSVERPTSTDDRANVETAVLTDPFETAQLDRDSDPTVAFPFDDADGEGEEEIVVRAGSEIFDDDDANDEHDLAETVVMQDSVVEEALPLDEANDSAADTAGDEVVEPVIPAATTPMGALRGVTVSEGIRYRLPAKKALERGRKETGRPEAADNEPTARKLVEALGHFGVEAKVVGIVNGPHVSRYELRLAPGIKVKKVSELANDLAYALASTEIRILAPIPGKQAVGVEVPNSKRRMVRLGDIYEGRPEKASPLVAWLGKGIDGRPVWTDLSKMPHVLVAGTTGSGKSGCVNAILSSILMHSDPNEVRLVLVDPKQVELNHYENVPHLLTPVVTSPRLAANVLSNLITEMESRYGVMGQARCRNLAELNRARSAAGEPALPHILCVIDELADLMMVAPAEVEDSIIRLAQKSRATGIHLVLATQRPSTDIITGTIKVNIPARIAFAVSSQTDSRVILDQGGAESLLGQGDMLFRGAGTSKMERIQGAFVTEDEIAKITDHWSQQGTPEFDEDLLESKPEEGGGDAEKEFDPDSDDLLERAIRLVIETETASVSMIQRRLRVGYTRAGRLVDMLERRGVISGYEGSKPRQVLVTEADLPRILGWGTSDSTPAEGDEVTEDPRSPGEAEAPDGSTPTGSGAKLQV